MSRPGLIEGFTQKILTPCGNIYITLNSQEGKLIELFANLGKAGTCAKAQNEVIGRLISALVKTDTDIKKIIKTIKGIRCGDANESSISCADAIAKSLETFLETKTKEIKDVKQGS